MPTRRSRCKPARRRRTPFCGNRRQHPEFLEDDRQQYNPPKFQVGKSFAKSELLKQWDNTLLRLHDVSHRGIAKSGIAKGGALPNASPNTLPNTLPHTPPQTLPQTPPDTQTDKKTDKKPDIRKAKTSSTKWRGIVDKIVSQQRSGKAHAHAMNKIRMDEYKKTECEELDSYIETLQTFVHFENQYPRDIHVGGEYYMHEKDAFEALKSQSSLDSRMLANDSLCPSVMEELPSLPWIQDQLDYINSLKDAEFDILRSYSYWGDVLLNNFFRNNNILTDVDAALRNIFNIGHIIKFFPGVSTCEEFIIKYAAALNRIIHNAPKLDKDIIVYRGMMDDVYNKRKKNNMFTDIGFASSSLDPRVSSSIIRWMTVDEWNSPNKDPCVYHIRIPRGTPCIFAYTVSNVMEEMEILLPMNMAYYLHPTVLNMYPLCNVDDNELFSIKFLPRYPACGLKHQVENNKYVQLKTVQITLVGGSSTPLLSSTSTKTPLPQLATYRIINAGRDNEHGPDTFTNYN